MKLHDRFPKWRMPLWGTLLAAVLLAGFTTVLALWCQPNAFREIAVILRAQPLLIVLNAMPIGLLLLACTALCRNVFFGGALVNLAVGILSIANRIKLEVRDEPVFPRDFALLKEVGSAMENFDIHFPVTAIAVVIGSSVLLALLGLFIGCRPFPVKKLRGWLGSLLGIVASMAALAGLVLTVYASTPLYDSFHVSNPYRIPAVFNELGFPYCFCHQFTTYPVDKPEGFDKAAAEQWEQGPSADGTPDTPVSVIMVMNEAFADVSDDPVFAGNEQPLPNLHAIRQDPHALSGHLVVPGFAGGTANTEFDVLTGMQTNALSATTTSAMRVVNRNLDSLFRVFGEQGYTTSYFHPGDDWFYNRENVLRWMGAETTRFVDEMDAPRYKGRWVTDDYMAGQIEEEFERAVSAGKPLFNYTTTIQNHMSYTADKYGPDYAYPPLDISVPVSPEVRELLEVYVEGARDADAMLGRLRDYFAGREEPVVLAFWGDHLPYLGDNQQAYLELGFTERPHWKELASYETPYVLWANDAAAEALDWDRAVETLELPENELSAAFFGASVLELTGSGERTPWFAFLNTLRRLAPVVHKGTYLLPDGTVTNREALAAQDTEDAKALLAAEDQWRQWTYYKLKYKEVE